MSAGSVRSRSVSSTITTASAPDGIGAPVAISMHSPVAIPRAGTCPVNTRSTHLSVFGECAPARNVFSATTAYPSIAARSNGGTSTAAVTSREATRPSACASGTVSLRVIGAASLRTICSASSKSTVSVIGRMRLLEVCQLAFVVCREFPHDVPDFRQDEALHRKLYGGLGPGQHEDRASVHDPCRRAGQHGRGADVLVAQHSKQLAEAVNPFVEKRRHRFVCRIATGNAGSAGRDDHVDPAPADFFADGGGNLLGLVAHELAAEDGMTGILEHAGNRGAACHGGGRSGVVAGSRG